MPTTPVVVSVGAHPAMAMPKSITFTPASVSITLAGLTFAVDHAGGVRGVEGRGDTIGDPHDLVGRDRAPAEPSGQGLAVEELQDHERSLPVVAVVEDGGHVGVRDARRGPRLPVEASQLERVPPGCVGGQLHGHPPAEAQVLGLPHRAHPTGADPIEQAVATGQLRSRAGIGCRPHGPGTTPAHAVLSTASSHTLRR